MLLHNQNRLTGLDMMIELKRIVTIPDENRPPMVIKTTYPNHPAGIIWEGVSLVSLSTALEDGKITRIGVSMSQMDLGMQYCGWHPDGSEQPEDEYEAEWLEVYYMPDQTRVGMGPDALEKFLSLLPQDPDQELVDRQRSLEARLPRAQKERSVSGPEQSV